MLPSWALLRTWNSGKTKIDLSNWVNANSLQHKQNLICLRRRVPVLVFGDHHQAYTHNVAQSNIRVIAQKKAHSDELEGAFRKEMARIICERCNLHSCVSPDLQEICRGDSSDVRAKSKPAPMKWATYFLNKLLTLTLLLLLSVFSWTKMKDNNLAKLVLRKISEYWSRSWPRLRYEPFKKAFPYEQELILDCDVATARYQIESEERRSALDGEEKRHFYETQKTVCVLLSL